MRSNYLKNLKTAVLAATILLLGVSGSFAQVNLNAGPATATLPDGTAVPMWGYSCVSATGATCASLHPNVAAGAWSPVVITVPAGQNLTINLTNSLTFSGNSIPTSLVIVGQLGGGLGDKTQRTTTPSPDHTNAQGATTWPIAGGAGVPAPAQGPRVQSFSTEVAAGATTSLTWTAPRPGTYLLESGTHPSIQGPMGLYGMVVVTTAPVGTTAGTAYTGVSYNADVPLLFSEIDPVQNNAVNTAVNTSSFSETAVWSGLPGGCGVATVHTCYPPAVNYTPLYYLINGVAFDKTIPGTSLFPVSPASGVTGAVLVRMVNAGLRMHVPAIVGAQTGTTNTPGLSLIAEDGNPLPGTPRVQNEVFLAPGKTYDVMINAPASGNALPVFDRELSLSGNKTARDAGMLAYIGVNGSGVPVSAATATANPDTYNSVVAGQTLTVSDPAKGVIANDVNISGVAVQGTAPAGLTLNTDGTFTYTAGTPTTFNYCGNGATSGAACTTVTLGAAPIEAAGGITTGNLTFTSNVATTLSIKPPGVLAAAKDAAGYPLTVNAGGVSLPACTSLTPATPSPCGTVDKNGGFNAYVSGAGTYTFNYKAQNSQGTVSSGSGTVTLVFLAASNLQVSVVDGVSKAPIGDYRWIIEEDRTFYINPNNTANTGGTTATTVVPTFGTNFHTSYMPLIAAGCTGPLSCESGQTLGGVNAVCDVGNGSCRTDAAQQATLNPSQVHLDPTKRYYISVLPGDAGNPFAAGYALPPQCVTDGTPANNSVPSDTCGHGMGGAPIAAGQTAVTILSQPTPFQTARLSVFVFEDDFPLNGENDAGGGVDTISPNEPGLGGFNITLFDDAGGSGDATGQMTYDMFNMPLSNALAGTIDPATQLDACPISAISRQTGSVSNGGINASPTGITGTIVTCPTYEADGMTFSPLAGQAVVANLMPGRYGVVATPGADHIARGEEWLQTNTLDGQKAHDSFLRVAEPSYFQEFGPAGYHVSIGFANPGIINGRLAGVCNGSDINLGNGSAVPCQNTVKGRVTTERMSRTPDERLYSSGSNDSFSFTQCYASLGDPDGEDFAFTKCDANGNFTFTGIPNGSWRVTVFDQWNDMLVDGLSTPVGTLSGGTTNLNDVAMNQWQANIYTSTFFDNNHSNVMTDYSGTQCTAPGVPTGCNPNYGVAQPGLSLVATNIRFRDGSYSNFNNTDLSGNAGFNEVFPLFSWYVVETDTTRYKSTGVHVVYDAGGPADGTCTGTTAPCGSSQIGHFMANTAETVPVPTGLRVPGARYCHNADCPPGDNGGGSTGRIDPPFWFGSEGWQGFSGQNSFIEFGKAPYATKENGGIHGEVIYASTRPFDDPSLLIHTSWTPDVPGVTINLYQVGTAPDGSDSLKLVDTTTTSSWDDWAQGFRTDGAPNMNCPGQGRDTGTNADLFFFTLSNQPMWLDVYNNGGTPAHTIPNNSQFKCFDGMHNWNQVQPAPYDGMYSFPSVLGFNVATGKPVGTNCTICIPNPDTTDPYRSGMPMLPAGKYVVEMIVPPGYELVKEEDKNILIGDNYIAPTTQQFGGLGNIFILPDQAEVASLFNANNPQNSTNTLGRTTYPNGEGDTGSVEIFWPCVGASRVVPDFISLFPQSGEVSPFAGATRNLCDRKKVDLTDQTSVLAKFWIFTSTHVAAHFTGVITDDYTSEFDPFSPQFGEKFSPPDLPISIKDFSGNEISRTYADQWGTYNGLNYSTWEVNPPNPTGYAPTMMVTCMNDPGPIPGPNGTMITDPLYNPQYSQFCYEIPFMPGQTQYMDTPVVPTSAFAGAGYNNPDCAYPDTTPAVKEVDGDGIGPWVGVGKTSIASLTLVNSGSGYTSAPFTFNIPPAADGGQGQVTDLKLISIANFTCTTIGTNRCSNFVTNPTVTISGGGGATATATKSGSTISFTVTNPGAGYTSRPTISVRRITGGSANLPNSSASMGVNGIALTADGSGYSGGSFNFAISGSGGSGATATAALGTSSQILTITALGDTVVPNNAYSGPQQTTAPYNQKKVTRHYGFGGTQGTVTIGGVTVPPANITTWSDTQIVLTVPAGVPACPVQQQAIYGGSFAQCGELVIKAANGKQSVDAVTVTIGGKAPTVVSSGTIQSAIDNAKPGDLLIVPAGTYNEMVLMWKPVRLQGVAAASSIINANTHPAGKLDPWRRQVDCLFGLSLNATAISGSNPYDSTGQFTCAANMQFQVDRLPLEATVGWDATLNGNIAEQLQEPTLMGAYEGAGITVLGKGVRFPNGSQPFAADTFPTGTTLLTSRDCLANRTNPFPSNFQCNPSAVDGLGITDSSQGGGGIFVHAWAHNLQIANNRVNSNTGTVSGGISVGQGEFPPQYLQNGATPNADPGSCQSGGPTNTALPYCFNLNVNVHNNAITSNNSLGDELFSGTPSGAGGIAFCTGADFYKFQNNWVCGNLSTGDGGGVIHMGFSYNGDIEHNTIIFNQSINPTISTNGGGLAILGSPDTDPVCGIAPDADCAPGTSDGTGPGLVVNANLIMGNAAESGSGGGIRFQGVNGTELTFFPNRPDRWYTVQVTNNIIANNVAGWDGAGVSLQDALAVNFINNTVISNDTTASAGVLFNTLGAPIASSNGPCPGNTNPSNTNPCVTSSTPQPAGLVAIQNSATLTTDLNTLNITCPAGHFSGAIAFNANCKKVSYPLLANNVFWQNRAFNISVGALGAGTQNQQNVVTLVPTLNQPQGDATTSNATGSVTVTGGTGACTSGASYWDIGVRLDKSASTHDSGTTLNPTYSILTSLAGGYNGGTAHNLAANPDAISQYCNGSRIPPELGTAGYMVPPGISDATVPNPIFNLTPAATVDEGNNWINMSWGPLALTHPLTGAVLGNYAFPTASPAVDAIGTTASTYSEAPGTDYFGNARKTTTNPCVDMGAVDISKGTTCGATGGGNGALSFTPSPLSITLPHPRIGTGATGTGTVTVTNTGGSSLTISNVTVSGGSVLDYIFTIGPLAGPNTCNGATLAANGTCVVTVRFTNVTAPTGVDRSGTLTFTDTGSGSPQTLNLVGHVN